MGMCLCKDKVEEAPYENGTTGTNNDNNRQINRGDRIISLSETVDRLVKETLEVIGTIVDK